MVTQGKRGPDGNIPVEPGEYTKIDGEWWAKAPTPRAPAAVLSDHQVIEHEDGTITVSPSILMDFGPEGSPTWHGFLERGVWRE